MTTNDMPVSRGVNDASRDITRKASCRDKKSSSILCQETSRRQASTDYNNLEESRIHGEQIWAPFPTRALRFIQILDDVTNGLHLTLSQANRTCQ